MSYIVGIAMADGRPSMPWSEELKFTTSGNESLPQGVFPLRGIAFVSPRK